MGTFRTTIEIGDQTGRRFVRIEALVDTGATFTKAPRSLLESLNIPADHPYTAVLADGRRVPRQQGWVTMRLQRQQFPTAVTFGEETDGGCSPPPTSSGVPRWCWSGTVPSSEATIVSGGPAEPIYRTRCMMSGTVPSSEVTIISGGPAEPIYRTRCTIQCYS